MKNIVDEIIINFTKQELRDFRYFISRRNNHNHERKDLEYITRIRKNTISYDKGSNAYHQTKKRLKNQLEQFVQLENIRFDVTSPSFSYIETATYLFRKKMPWQAWSYLLKAEEHSLKNEDYILLDLIYYIQIAYASNIHGIQLSSSDFKNIIQKHNNNLLLSTLDANANAAYGELRYQIRELKALNKYVDIQTIIDSILKQYELTDKIYEHPRIYGKIVNIVCKGLAEIEEHQKMCEYVLSAFHIVKEKSILDIMHPDYSTEMLLSICQSLLWTKQYDNCSLYLELYTERLKVFQHRYDKYDYHYFMQQEIAAKICYCKGDIDNAENILLTLLKKYKKGKYNNDNEQILLTQLSGIYFSQGDIRQCIKLHNKLFWEKENRGVLNITHDVEVKILNEIYRIIYYYELNESDYALDLLQKVRRSNAAFLKAIQNKRYGMFIQIMEALLKKPLYIVKPKFKEQVQIFTMLKEYVPDYKEYISLNAWLTSKVTTKTYYECLLETVK